MDNLYLMISDDYSYMFIEMSLSHFTLAKTKIIKKISSSEIVQICILLKQSKIIVANYVSATVAYFLILLKPS